jgi:predicted PurR-regulated permease PerM
MSVGHDRQELRASATVVGVVVALIIFVYLVREILLPFVFAGILAYIFTPLVDWLTLRTRGPRWLFAVAVLLAIMVLAAIFGILGGPPLAHEIAHAGADLQGTVEALARQFLGNGTFTLLGETVSAQRIGVSVAAGVRAWFDAPGSAIAVTVWSFVVLFGFILSWVLLGYLLIDAHRIADGLFWLVPPHHRPFVHRVWNDLDPVLRRYFVGVALVIIYASLVAYIGLGLILHIHHAVFLALLTGMLEVIPIVGPGAAAVIAGLVAVHQAQSAWSIIAYVIYASALRISIDQFFGPIVLGQAAYVRPVLVIFCFMTGGLLFGVVGVVLAIPVALAIKASLAELYRETGRR